ncbi:S-adenosyl-L-methionine-dependent methyltransferase [Pluteus cervinus]|uniref:S-adenosyl-L-methionine-dependent methyltransferase n=1 Tax=Pluteus cervinus TaxID=181527 RepID=A0ACD3AH03_9AGAR|nr:S-adenosyl-L-methionine-dependent methyltransferase [Pluteus cervinus]
MSLKLYQELALAEGLKKEPLYVIASDGDYLEAERKRLNMQHDTIVDMFNKKLIFAPVTFTRGDCILDCGTGTGIWAEEVAKIVPRDVIVEGTDISRRFFPSPGENPAVIFHNLSTLDLPTEWENRFTLVNQRLMIACFSWPQWETALHEIYRVLKPGGWAQILEIQQKHEFSATHPKFQRLLDIVHPMMRARGFILDTGLGIEEIMQRGGYKNVTRTHRAAPMGEWGGEQGRGWWSWIQGAYRGMKDAVLRAGTVESGEEFDRVVKEAFDESNDIPGVAHDMEVIYGQKIV